MIIPTSIKLNCRTKDASSSVLTSADDRRERRDASRSVMRSVVEDDCLVDTKSTLYNDYTWNEEYPCVDMHRTLTLMMRIIQYAMNNRPIILNIRPLNVLANTAASRRSRSASRLRVI